MKHFRQLPFLRKFTFSQQLGIASRSLFTMLVCLLALPGMARIWYVTPTNSGSGSGNDWANATSSLTTALDNANYGDQIWVKTGYYRRYDQHSFQIKNGVKLYGGFAGNESSASARSTNLSAYPVNITNSPTQSGTNSTNYDQPVFIVVNADNTSLIDRIFIANAFTSAYYGPYRGIGAAIWMDNSSAIINNVTFSNSTAEYKGGSIFMTNSSPSFTSCAFTNNSCIKEAGGAVWAENNSSPTFTNTTFSSNYSIVPQSGGSDAVGKGGAIYMRGGKLSLNKVTFSDNGSKSDGGAIYFESSTANSPLTNVVFENNKSGYNGSFSTQGEGGAICAYTSNYIATNCVFSNNRSGGNGGAIYNALGTATGVYPKITNTLFYNNGTSTNLGGAIANDRVSAVITNCTLVGNYCGNSAGAGGVYSSAPSGSFPTDNPSPVIVNCVFKRNGYSTSSSGSIATMIDIVQLRATTAVSYTYFKEKTSFSGTGNILSDDSHNPFINDNGLAAAKGSDGVWMTADDGFRPAFCAPTMIDKGNNDAINNTTGSSTDLGGQTRKFNVQLVPDSGNGSSPIVDIGAYENQDASTATNIAGTIGNPHIIPSPQELRPDYITNTQNPASGSSYFWQVKVPNSAAWVTADSVNNQLQYAIPTLVFPSSAGNTATYTFRRVATSATYCNLQVPSNEVQLKLVIPNGIVSGRVTSTNGTGVPGIIITATRKRAISGSPARYIYTTTTGTDGSYTLDRIYYGDPSANASSRDSFSVSASLQGHTFNYDSLTVTLSNTANSVSNINFIDRTVLSITGRTYQQCTDCNGISGVVQTQTCPIDSVTIFKDGLYNTLSGFIDTAYGRYAVAITDPVSTRIEPRFTGHTFNPAFRTLTPTTNVQNVDFQDVTTHTISGKITAGCGEFIGTAVLEFTDTLPLAANGNSRNVCFRKRVTTDATTGAYSITLPARKYRVSLVSFTPKSGANAPLETEVLNFINVRTPADSLIRNISTRDTTLNLLYVRPPVVSITQGLNIVCTTPTEFAIVRQAFADSFRVQVYQGPASIGCPLADTNNKIKILTNVQQEDAFDSVLLAVVDTGINVKIAGGIPNITGDHLKDLYVYFRDKYGRDATPLRRRVLVTGVKPDVATFTTVSPEVPLVVLHDPPGDASSSTWQQNKSISNAVRFYSANSIGGDRWIEAKIGAETTVGIGVAVDVKAWGTIRGSIGVNASTTSANEAILTTTTSQSFSTSGNPEVTGSNGDVYIGAALNLIYSVATDIGFNSCGNITSRRRLIVADSGFATQYIYSEDYIINTLIPNLQSLAQLSNTADSAKYINQIKVWQQVVDNNAENKRRAAFVENRSFDGSAGPYTNTTTTSSSKTSSVEFALEINASVAAELGVEVAGSGASGGVNVNFRMETGDSKSSTVTEETTISYTLDDNTPGDFFSVNVKKDPVYNTPVFELAAGTASCPSEPGAQPRDAVFFTANSPVALNVAPTAPANFNLKIVNTSAATGTNPTDKRVYKLSYVQSSNTANETITIAGTAYNSSSPYITRPLGYLDSVIVPVSITRQSGSSVYSYEGEQFFISSSCDEDLGNRVTVSAYFTSPCSSISLTQPIDGWVLNRTSNNQLFVKPSGYDLSTLSSVNVQYSTGNTWTDVFPALTVSQLTNGFNFDASSLPDGPYGIRLRLDCSTGTVFSQRATGIIDRRPPLLFGRPDPTDDNYVNGDAIAFTYDEKLDNNASSLQVTMRRLSNNTLISATATIYENKISIVPGINIATLTGDSILLVVGGVKDAYGNIKTMADTIRFTVGTSVPATGNQALLVSITNPTVYKNDTAAIRVVFNLPANAANDTRVNYTIGGTARYGIDYTATYTSSDALYASFNGSTGSIKIPKSARTATLTLRPVIGDTAYSPDKTIIISATEGGDYGLGATTSVTGNLTSEDGISTYTFTGDGNWTIKNNWLNGKMPLTTLIAPKEIIINPIGTCILNVPQTIRTGAKVTVKQNRRFIIQGFLKQN